MKKAIAFVLVILMGVLIAGCTVTFGSKSDEVATTNTAAASLATYYSEQYSNAVSRAAYYSEQHSNAASQATSYSEQQSSVEVSAAQRIDDMKAAISEVGSELAKNADTVKDKAEEIIEANGISPREAVTRVHSRVDWMVTTALSRIDEIVGSTTSPEETPGGGRRTYNFSTFNWNLE